MLEPISGVSSTNSSSSIQQGETVVRSVTSDHKGAPTAGNGDSPEKVEQKMNGGKDPVSQIKEAVDKMNLDERFRRTGCEFTYHEISHRVSITLYDKETKEVIKEIPPEETIDMIDKFYKLAGLVIDERL